MPSESSSAGDTSRGILRARTFVLALGAALLFVALASYRLERTGAQYDELHQATGAFAYVGRPTDMFSFVRIGGVPLLNMSYTGAIKTAVYGLYMRATGRPFSIVSWRLLGILFSAAGILLFTMLTADRVPAVTVFVFLALLLTDTNLLLQSRHDWGPAALAFLLRMLLIGVFVRQATGARGRWGPLLLGLIVGIAAFEKLSSMILLAPLAIMLIADPTTRDLRSLIQAAAGGAIGALPVIVVNLYSLLTSGRLLALASADVTSRRSLVSYAANYLAIGNGGVEQRMMFEAPAPQWAQALEAAAIVVLIGTAGVVLWKRRGSTAALLPGAMLASWAAIGVVLPLLPHGTGVHHWIIGTPFQYFAIALVCGELWRRGRPRGASVVLAVGVLALLIARVPAIDAVADGLRHDTYTKEWGPSLNAAAQFIAKQPPSAIVITANWGIGTQAFCFANGREDFVFELYQDYGGPRDSLNPILADPRRQVVVAAALRPDAPLKPGEINTLREVTGNILHDLEKSPGWVEVPVDPSVRGLRSVELRMFERNAAGPGL